MPVDTGYEKDVRNNRSPSVSFWLRGKEKKEIEKQDITFRFFAMTIENMETQISKTLMERIPECIVALKTNYDNNCSKIKKYKEIPVTNNHIIFCTKELKDK